jgi:general stress protein 26
MYLILFLQEVTAMEKEVAVEKGLDLIKRSKTCLIGTNTESGHPNVKAMLTYMNEGLNTIWFTTNTPSKKVKQVKRDEKACVYYYDPNAFEGLMLVGKMEALQDEESRKKVWKDEYTMYYPQGVNDPDYTVLKFTTESFNLYAGFSNTTFDL